MAHYFRSSGTTLNWGTVGNWSSTPSPTYTAVAAIPTASDDVIFEAASASCNVNVAAVCANLNFNSGTGYVNTITMTNSITVGLTVPLTTTNMAVTLSAGMTILGTGAINTRNLNTGTLTLRSNGKQWPNAFGILNTALSATSGNVAIADNWTIGGTLTIGSNVNSYIMTFSGAFTITCLSNLAINVSGVTSSNRIAATSGSITTIALTGTGTWSSVAPVYIGLNITINAPSQTVTIGDNCSYGGTGTQTGSSFTYAAGTVVTTGTFHLMFAGGGVAYTVNLFGNNSTSATTTSTSGVNFNNLTFRTLAQSAPQSCNVTGNLCVVNDTTVTSIGGVGKNIFNLIGGNLYVNKNFTVNGYSSSGTTTIRLQGTGTWTENLTLSQGVSVFGITNPVVITGNITLGSFVGMNSGSTLTYTSGTFVTTGFGLRLLGCTVAGFGSAGITIESIYHATNGAATSVPATITITDTSPLLIGTLTLTNSTSSNTHRYLGTSGWTCNSFSLQLTSTVTSTLVVNFTGSSTVTYRINSSFVATSFSPLYSCVFNRSVGTVPVNFILAPGASQDVYYVGATFLNSSAGQTIWSRKGTITSTTNWNLWTYPKTRFSSFTS